MTPTGKANSMIMDLTPKGRRVVELLSEVEETLGSNELRDQNSVSFSHS